MNTRPRLAQPRLQFWVGSACGRAYCSSSPAPRVVTDSVRLRHARAPNLKTVYYYSTCPRGNRQRACGKPAPQTSRLGGARRACRADSESQKREREELESVSSTSSDSRRGPRSFFCVAASANAGRS